MLEIRCGSVVMAAFSGSGLLPCSQIQRIVRIKIVCSRLPSSLIFFQSTLSFDSPERTHNMPTCFCTDHGCRDWGGVDSSTGEPKGRSLSAKTYKTHLLSEKTKMYNEAQQEADVVVERQIEEIAEFIAANTLADGVSGTSACPGGRLWATNNEGAHRIREMPKFFR